MLSPGKVIDRVAAGWLIVEILLAEWVELDTRTAPVVPGDGGGPRECIVYGPNGPEFGWYDPRPGAPRRDDPYRVCPACTAGGCRLHP